MIDWLSPQGFFLFYSFTSFIGFIFVYFCIGETMGLSEKEKKLLYQPGGKFGRKLSHSDVISDDGDSASTFESIQLSSYPPPTS